MRTLARKLLSCLAAGTVWTAGLGLAAVGAGVAAAPPAAALGDGLALTPPMGFNNWNSTHCRADFNESMVEGIADLFVAKGLKDAGYRYVNLDDCWALPQRDASGNLVPDPVRFPHGIKAVADYVHGKGLKIGIYTSAGTKTCNSAGFPGGLGHEQRDAGLFASWGIDYLKYDNCNNQGVDAKQRYTAMRDALKATGRPIVFSICEWGQNQPWLWASDVGHLWRTTGDISDNWSSMLSIAKKNLPLAPYAGPGHWNDPDMLEVGNGGMTDTEYRTHFSLWSMMAAPLLIGSDLRKASSATLQILGNREVIALDQDPLGRQGTVISSSGGAWVIVKQLAGGDRAVALFNESDHPQRIATTAAAAGLPASDDGYRVRDLWQHTDYHSGGVLAGTVPGHGTTVLRVGTGHHAGDAPPLLDTGLALPAPRVEAGGSTTATAYATGLGSAPVRKLELRLDAPAGWRAAPTSAVDTRTLAADDTFHTTWQVSAPPGTPSGSYPLDGTATYWAPRDNRWVTVPLHGEILLVVPPPHGIAYLGDLPWTSATNGWGPVERNTSVGETKAGDGHPLTIGGVVYPKGLGVHAPSTVEYHLGGHCSVASAMVGVDDEKGSAGTVDFQLVADGRVVADSGVLTNAMPAQPIAADISGAQSLQLVVGDGGDGVDSDHADWADAKLTCA